MEYFSRRANKLKAGMPAEQGSTNSPYGVQTSAQAFIQQKGLLT